MKFGIFYELQLPRPWASGDEHRLYQNALEQIEIADRCGYDHAWQVEHHFLEEYSHSPVPESFLAAASQRTKQIRLGHGIMQLTTNHPARVAEKIATLDLLSNGRAEIMVGRGSFIESFPLFGHDLDDYDSLFAEKLDLLLKLREAEAVRWTGQHRPALTGMGVYPRPLQNPLPIWVAVGGTPASVERAGRLGLPLALAIIGGEPERFAPLVAHYRESGRRAGDHEASSISLAARRTSRVVIPARQSGTRPRHRSGGCRIRLHGLQWMSIRTIFDRGESGA